MKHVQIGYIRSKIFKTVFKIYKYCGGSGGDTLVPTNPALGQTDTNEWLKYAGTTGCLKKHNTFDLE